MAGDRLRPNCAGLRGAALRLTVTGAGAALHRGFQARRTRPRRQYINRERTPVFVDRKFHAIRQEPAQHDFRSIGLRGLGRFRQHVKPDVIQPGGTAQNAVIVLKGPGGADQIRHRGLMQFIAISCGIVATPQRCGLRAHHRDSRQSRSVCRSWTAWSGRRKI